MTSRLRIAALVAALTILVAACGSTVDADSGHVRRRRRRPADPARPSILPIPITAPSRVGDNRVVFTLTDSSGQKQVAGSRIGRCRSATTDRSGETIAPAPQTFIWAIEGVNGVYVGHATFPSAGQWTADFTTAAPGSAAETTTFSFDVRDRSTSCPRATPRRRSKTPTLADVGGDVAKISTDPTAGEAVLRDVRGRRARGEEAVRPDLRDAEVLPDRDVCGPTLDKLKPVAAAHPEMTFINVEPYQLKFTDGALQPVLTGQD